MDLISKERNLKYYIKPDAGNIGQKYLTFRLGLLSMGGFTEDTQETI